MMGKMAVGLLGLMGKGLLGGGTRRAGTALSILGKGSGCMRSGGQGGGSGRGGRNSSPLEEALTSLLERNEHAAKACLSTASRSELEASSADADIIDVCAVEKTASARGSTAEREAALKALALHIVSFTDGRVRLRHEVFKKAFVHAPLQQALTAGGKFTSVEFKASTGSALLLYDAGKMSRTEFMEAALPLGSFLAEN